MAFSDAAAKTVSVADPAGGADGPALEPPTLEPPALDDEAELVAFPLDDTTAELAAADTVLEDGVDEVAPLPLELQPTTVAATHTAVTAASILRE